MNMKIKMPSNRYDMEEFALGAWKSREGGGAPQRGREEDRGRGSKREEEERSQRGAGEGDEVGLPWAAS